MSYDNPEPLEAVDSTHHLFARQIRDVLRPRSGPRRTIVIDGEAPLESALRTGVQVNVICFIGEDPPNLASDLSLAGVRTVRMATAVARELFGSEKVSPVFALARQPKASTLDDIATRAGDILVLDSVRIVGNIGAIIRSACALGAAGVVLLDSGLTSIGDRRLIRASRGLVFSIPVVLSTSALLTDFLRDHRVALVSLDAHASTPMQRIGEDSNRIAILLGNERSGPSRELAARAERQVSVRMRPGVDSLNVSVAAALALYERQAPRRDRTVLVGGADRF